jgi:hypothetical protein
MSPSVGNEFPSGGIILWSGAVSDIPAGWFLCNGSNGTPNLTDRFVIHADADSGGTNDVGDTGGSHTASVPAHDHSGSTSGSIERGSDSTVTFNTNVTHHQHNIPTQAAVNLTITPKYYALAYIMKS